MKNIFFKLAIIATSLILVQGCSSSGDSSQSSASAAVDDTAYFEAAKQYLTYNHTFGAQTDLTSHSNHKKIQFNSLPQHANSFPFAQGNLGHILTVRKSFVANADNTLIMIKRNQASRKDNTTMTVSMTTGQKTTRQYVAGVGFQSWPDKTYKPGIKTDQCERIVFNADGVGVCLNQSGSSVVMTKLSEKFGHRVVTSCNTYTNGSDTLIGCSDQNKLVSSKELNLTTNELTLGSFHN